MKQPLLPEEKTLISEIRFQEIFSRKTRGVPMIDYLNLDDHIREKQWPKLNRRKIFFPKQTVTQHTQYYSIVFSEDISKSAIPPPQKKCLPALGTALLLCPNYCATN